MNNSIKKNQNKVIFLDAQDDALYSYFDSLLFTDENDLIENNELIIEPVEEPQPVIKQPQTVKNPQPIFKQFQPLIKRSQPVIDKAVEEEKLIVSSAEKKISSFGAGEINTRYIPNKLISKGPVSPKPRELEAGDAELRKKEQLKTASISSEIFFSVKNEEGEIVNQVLTPRSQIMKAADKTPQQRSIAKQYHQPEPESIAIKEAPEVDLSLFLPRIKTLSNEEVKQQHDTISRVSEHQLQAESDPARAAKPEQQLKKKVKLQDELNTSSLRTPNAPSWAESDFQVLLFTVSGFKLAVPLKELNGILQWGDEYINELPGHASWYLGLIRNQGVNIPVIDTLQQIMPKKRWPEDYLVQRKFKYIILIDNSRWGLACEKVVEVITVKTDAVKWRSSRTKRRWLSGTVIEHMCALLDSAEFSTMLKTGDDSIIDINF